MARPTKTDTIRRRIGAAPEEPIETVVLSAHRSEWERLGWSQFSARSEVSIERESWFARTREPLRAVRDHAGGLAALLDAPYDVSVDELSENVCDVNVDHPGLRDLPPEFIAALEGWFAAELSLSTVPSHRRRAVVGVREENTRLKFRVVTPVRTPFYFALLGSFGNLLGAEFQKHNEVMLSTYESAQAVTVRAVSSEQRLAQVLETLDEGYFERRRDGSFRSSHRFRNITGIEADSFEELRSTWLKRTPIEDLERNVEAFDAMAEGPAGSFTLALIIEGKRRVFEAEARVDDDVLTATVTDETARYDALARSAVRKSTLHSLLETAPYAVAVHRDNEVIFANDVYLNNIEPLLSTVTDSTINVSPSSSMLTENEFALLGQDGIERTYELATSMIDWLGAGAFMTVFRDVTEERAFLARSFDLDRIVALGTLADGVAHEINNPLAYVQSNLEFAMRRLKTIEPAPESASDLYEVLGEAVEGAQRVSELVRDFRTVSPGEAGSELELFDVSEVISSAKSLASATVKPRANISTTLNANLVVRGSASRLAQVVINLLVNAAQAFPVDERGQIEISASDDGVGTVTIEVRDTGAGIPDDIIAEVFKPFFTTKPAGEGTGLGLSICRNIIRGMGGELDISSVVGVGTRATIELPGVRAPLPLKTTSLAEDSSSMVWSSFHVMVLDDDVNIGRMVARVLDGRYEVTAPPGPAEALRLANDRPFDLLLVDTLIPGMDVDDFFEELLDLGDEYRDRVVLMSGGRIRQPFESPLPVLEKPFRTEDLRSLIRDRSDAGGLA